MLMLTLLACRGLHGTGATPLTTGDTAQTAVVPWVAPDQTGPYPVGVTTIAFTDARGKPLTLEVWYPAASAGEALASYYPLPITGSAFRDVEPASGGPFPLLAFSHGFAGIRFQSFFLNEHLASHGFITVAPDHTHNTFLDLDEDLTPQVLYERPDDIRAAVDEVHARSAAADPILGGLLDPDAGYGMYGHSFGAVTSLVLAGGAPDYSGILTYCASNSALACRYIDGVDQDASAGHGTVDDRIRGTVAMSPGLPYAFELDGSGLADVRGLLVLAGDRDDVLEYDTEALPVYHALGSPKTLATFADGGHYAFSDICRMLAGLFPDCAGPSEGWIDIGQAQQITQTVTTAYFGIHVLDDPRYAPWLEASILADYPELTWTQE